MRTKRGGVLLAALVLALLVAACGGGETTSGGGGDAPEAGFTTGRIGPEETGQDPVQGGKVTFAAFVEIPGLDPVVPTGNGCCGLNELGAIFDPLMRYDPDTGDFVPQMAESLESDDDFTEWTLTLRPDVTFTDGTAFDAEAVVFNLERHAEGRFASLIGLVDEFEAVDDTTVVMRMDEPWAGLPFMLSTMPGLIGSPTAIEELGEEFNTKPVGAGPFQVKRWSPGEELVLEPNPDYWGEGPYLDELRFVLLPDPLGSLKAGDIQVSTVRTAGDLERAETDGMSGYVNHQNSGLVMLLNNCDLDNCTKEDPITADVRVRQALTLAVDPEVWDKQLYEGKAGSSYDLFSESSRWHTTSGIEPDREEAKRLVEEVKADTGWDGKLSFKGSEELGVALQSQADAAGFDVNVEPMDVAAIIETMNSGDFEVLASSWNLDDANPYFNLANRLVSTRSTNTVSYGNPKADELIEGLRGTADPDETQALLDDLQSEFDETFPSLVLGAVPEGWVWVPELNGVLPTSTSGILFHSAFLAD